MSEVSSAAATGAPPLPPLPERMVGRPFGTDEAGRSVVHSKGYIIRGAVEYMLECVQRRAAASLPAEMAEAEWQARLATARAEALDQLVSRLNAAIPDPAYHITAEYLLDDSHGYSLEFDAFFCELCRQMSGDPRYHFNRASKTIPTSLSYLARPFSISQVYGLLPRLISRFVDTDLHVVRTSPGLAVVRLYLDREREQLSDVLWRLYIPSACQHGQGALAHIPVIHSGLPVATTRDLCCVMKGDPYCEWEFTWQEPQRRRDTGTARWSSAANAREADQAGQLDAGSEKVGASLAVGETATESPSPSQPLPVLAEVVLPPLPEHMVGRPFGADENGRPITHTKGDVIRTAMLYMLECVERRMDAELPPERSAEEHKAQLAAARAEAQEQLVTRINAAIQDPAYHVSAEYLMDTHHSYSIEFDIYYCEICRQLSGDPNFHFHRGRRTIPPSMAFLVRPFTVSQAFGLVPRLVSKFADLDLRVVCTGGGSAVIQWYEDPELEALPGYLRQHYIASSCPTLRGALVQLPNIVAELPEAQVREVRCLLRGDPCCEWEFSWQEPARKGLRLPWRRTGPGNGPQGREAPRQKAPRTASQTRAAQGGPGPRSTPVREMPAIAGPASLPQGAAGQPVATAGPQAEGGRAIAQAKRLGLYRLWPWATQDRRVQRELQTRGLPRPSLSAPLGLTDGRPRAAQSGSDRAALGEAGTAGEMEWGDALPPLPEFMQVRPYGADERGRPIRQANGSSIVGAIEQMQDYAAEQAMSALPARASEAERQAAAARARRESLDGLVARLNGAIADPSYRVTRDYLLNTEHYYSHEFNLYANEFAREICGDPQFFYHRGLRSIPKSIIHVARPLSLAQIYRMLPSLVAKVTQADVRTALTADQSAVLQWHPGCQFEDIPPAIHRHYMRMACRAYQGAYASIPQLHSGLAPARVRELHCLLKGDSYCEWEFTWVAPKPHLGLEVWGSVALTLLLVAALALRLAILPWLAAMGVLLPIIVALMSWRLKRVAYDRNQQRRLLLDQRESAEQHYDELQQASANLQLSNVALQRRLSELTALHEIGTTTGATLDLDVLLDSSLEAVTSRLGFDRALILLADEKRRVLAAGHSAGGTPELAAVVRTMAISMDNEESFLAEAVHLGQPVVVADATQATDEETLGYVRALQAHNFVAVPLLVHGAPLGVLAVDNVTTGRPLPEESHELLMTVGSQIAGAIDRVRLYQTLEQRVAERTGELAAANERMQLEIQERVRAEERMRQASETVRESERRLAYIIDFWPDPAFVLDAEGRVTSWNRAIEEMTGVPAKEMLGQGDYAYAVPFYGERRPILIDLVGLPDDEIERRYAQLKRDGAVLTGEAMVPALRGKRAYLYAMASALYDSQGRPVGAIETIRDITARREAEEAVRRSEAHLQSLVLNSPTAIVVIDLKGHVVSWNPAAEALFGYSQDEAIGAHIDDLVAGTEGMRAQAAMYTQQAARGETVRAISQRLRRDGSLVDLELLAVPLVVQGVQTSTLVMYHDITELQRARQEAEVANQAKSSFLATMSHEIRTPMNAVIGMTGLLLDTQLTAEQREFAETIRASGDSLLTIINDILDFSKIEAGRMDLESQPFDLRECVESAVDLLAPRAAEKGLNLASLVEDRAPATIVGDVTRLRQILVNLLGNAVKFTERGEVVLSVQLEPLAPSIAAPSDLTYIHFSVRDTGIGIPPDRMDRLFRSFSQVDASTTRRFGGTGLGLAISKRLCELMGGTMWVESKGIPGEGSTFHFGIRAQTAPALAQRARLRGLQPRLAGKRALIVDDNPTNRRIVTLQTQSWGMIAHDTGMPSEALAWVRRGDPFDVAFLDRQMPEMDGLTLAHRMRELRDEASLPIVMLSSWGQREVEGGDAPYVAFLMKPLKASQIYDVLVSLFGTEEQVTELAQGPASSQFDAQMAERHPLRILLAEDNATNQKLALRLLGRMGYRADVAASGVEALASLRRQRYDVVLMDVQMPEMDGLEATRAIWREWPAGGRPRIVAMTANAMKEDRDECLAAGMDDYISKPIHVEELVRALNACQPMQGATCPLPGASPVGLGGRGAKDEPVAAPGPAKPAIPEGPVEQASIFDHTALAKLLEIGGGDQAFLLEMIDTFVADAPGILGQMRQAVERGDAPLLRRSAHSLKSNSRDFGATTLSQMCLELENMGKESNLDGAADKLSLAEAEYARVAQALQALRQG